MTILNPFGGPTSIVGMGTLNDPKGSSAPALLDLVVIWWQSNAIGLAQASNITIVSGYDQPYPVRFFQRIAMSTSGLPVWTDYDSNLQPRPDLTLGGGNMGCELSLFRTLDAAYPGRFVGGKYAISGSDMATRWKPGGTYPVGQDPLFIQLGDKIEEWQTLSGSQLFAMVGVGFEEDAQHPEMYAVLEDNVRSFQEGIWARFGSDVQFIYNHLHRVIGSGIIVNDTQVEIANNLENTYLVEARDLSTLVDGVHFDADGQVILGQRIAVPILTPPPHPNAEIPEFHIRGDLAEGTGNITPTFPSNTGATGLLRDGDWALLPISSFTSQAVTVPANWTQVGSSPQDSAAAIGGNRLTVIMRKVEQAVLDANSGNMPAPTILDPGSYAVGQIIAFRGLHPTNPIDVTAGSSTGAVSDTLVSIPGGQTNFDNELIVLFVGIGTDAQSTNEASALANNDLDNLREIIDVTRSVGSGGGFLVAVGEKPAMGPFGPTTALLATASGQAKIMLALRGP